MTRAGSTNKVLTNIINNFLNDYYLAHNKSIDYTRKTVCKNKLDDALIKPEDMQSKYALIVI